MKISHPQIQTAEWCLCGRENCMFKCVFSDKRKPCDWNRGSSYRAGINKHARIYVNKHFHCDEKSESKLWRLYVCDCRYFSFSASNFTSLHCVGWYYSLRLPLSITLHFFCFPIEFIHFSLSECSPRIYRENSTWFVFFYFSFVVASMLRHQTIAMPLTLSIYRSQYFICIAFMHSIFQLLDVVYSFQIEFFFLLSLNSRFFHHYSLSINCSK